MSNLKFTIFSDLHYKKGMYAATVDDLKIIFNRAAENGSDFVMHLGDLCNDYLGSPELVKAYLNNEQGLAVYGIYGNHELESNGNSMEVVTPLLTNDSEVVWGTENGKASPETAYYYKDFENFRFIFTDSNYSLTKDNEFEHNRTNSYGPPSENTGANMLSDKQFAWLEKALFSAAEKGMQCIVYSHAAFAEKFTYSTDAEKVRTLLNKVNAFKKGTVIAAINGHWHANDYEIKDDILYFNINSAKNGCWLPTQEPHYDESHTYTYMDFDSEGNLTETREVPLTELWMAKNTWFFDAPLSTNVTLTDDGQITVEGFDTAWMWNIVPEGPKVSEHRTPHISSVSHKANRD